MAAPISRLPLADFILTNTAQILEEWDGFARTVWPHVTATPKDLRDHAEAIIRAAALDMQSEQTSEQQSQKSKGAGGTGASSVRLTNASEDHAKGRATSGFDLRAVIAEYRALRASVIRLWRQSLPEAHPSDLVDIIRFNEAMDQSLSDAVQRYTAHVEQARQLFLGILGHDLRIPLNAIMLSSQNLSEACARENEPAILARQITASGEAMAAMLNDFLDFAGSSLGGTMPIKPEAVDLRRLADDILSELRAASPGHTFTFEATGDLTGSWDTGRLRQLLSNLLGNAVQHGDASKPIELRIKSESSGVTLTVSNEGSVIPPDLLHRIFDPLVRGPGSKERRGSMGLGLCIAERVVTAHGGTIKAESGADGHTVFTASLPRSPVSAQ